MNTCFTPTPYRGLHVGHAWIAHHNWRAAHQSSGRFILIIDDRSYYWRGLDRLGWHIDKASEVVAEELTWLGCPPDRVMRSSENTEAHEAAWAQLDIKPPGWTLTQGFLGDPLRDALGVSGATGVYAPAAIAHWVVDDAIAGVDGFFNGEEFLPEQQLYDYFTRRLGYRAVGQTFLRHIWREGALTKESKGNAGTLSLSDLRDAGYTPAQVLSTLYECSRRAEARDARTIKIPAGVLEVPEPKWLEYREHLNSALKEAQGQLWEESVKRTVRKGDWRWV